jgi:hypothetical protein
MMDAANTSETPVNLYKTTRRDNPEDSHLHCEIFVFCVSVRRSALERTLVLQNGKNRN